MHADTDAHEETRENVRRGLTELADVLRDRGLQVDVHHLFWGLDVRDPARGGLPQRIQAADAGSGVLYWEWRWSPPSQEHPTGQYEHICALTAIAQAADRICAVLAGSA